MHRLRYLAPAGAAAVCLLSTIWLVARPVAPSPEAPELDPPRPAPPMALEMIDGTTLDSSELDGKVVLLEVWATWCGKCVSEIPVINRLYRDRDDDVAVVGVTLQSGNAGGVAALVEAELHIAYPLAMSSDAFEQDFGPVWGLPMTLLLDRKWRVRKTWIGIRPGKEAEMRTLVDRLVSEPAD